MSERLARLQEQLEEPLLVSSLVNVRYLTGLASSNAALLVTPEGSRLYTDFRYAERARAVQGVELVETRRDIYAELPSLVQGRVGFEPNALSCERHAILEGGGLELVPRHGLVEAMRAVKDDGELGAIRRAAAVTNEAFERLSEETFVGRCERDLAWRMESLFHELGGDEPAFPVIVAAGPAGGSPARGARRPRDRAGGDDRRGCRLPDRRLLLGLHADVPDGRAPRRAGPRVPGRAGGTARRPRGGARREPTAPTSTGGRAMSSRRPASAGSSATASGTASASRCTRRPG